MCPDPPLTEFKDET